MAHEGKEKHSLEWLRQHTDLGPIKASNQQTQANYQALGKTLGQAIKLLPEAQQESAQQELSNAYGAIKPLLLAKNDEERDEFDAKLNALEKILKDKAKLIIEKTNVKRATELAEKIQALLVSLSASVGNNIKNNERLAAVENPESVTIKSIGDRRNMSTEDLKKIIYFHDGAESIIGGNITRSADPQGKPTNGYTITGSNPADVQKVVEHLHQSGATKITVTSNKPNKQMIQAARHAARLGITAQLALTSEDGKPSPEMQAWNKIFGLIKDKTSKLDRYNALGESEDGAELQKMYLNAQESLPHDVAAIYQGLKEDKAKQDFVAQISDFGLKQMVSGFQGDAVQQNNALVDIYTKLDSRQQKMLLTAEHPNEDKWFAHYRSGEPVLSTDQLLVLYANVNADLKRSMFEALSTDRQVAVCNELKEYHSSNPPELDEKATKGAKKDCHQYLSDKALIKVAEGCDDTDMLVSMYDSRETPEAKAKFVQSLAPDQLVKILKQKAKEMGADSGDAATREQLQNFVNDFMAQLSPKQWQAVFAKLKEARLLQGLLLVAAEKQSTQAMSWWNKSSSKKIHGMMQEIQNSDDEAGVAIRKALTEKYGAESSQVKDFNTLVPDPVAPKNGWVEMKTVGKASPPPAAPTLAAPSLN